MLHQKLMVCIKLLLITHDTYLKYTAIAWYHFYYYLSPLYIVGGDLPGRAA